MEWGEQVTGLLGQWFPLGLHAHHTHTQAPHTELGSGMMVESRGLWEKTKPLLCDGPTGRTHETPALVPLFTHSDHPSAERSVPCPSPGYYGQA